jgi:hypothetical protein
MQHPSTVINFTTNQTLFFLNILLTSFSFPVSRTYKGHRGFPSSCRSPASEVRCLVPERVARPVAKPGVPLTRFARLSEFFSTTLATSSVLRTLFDFGLSAVCEVFALSTPAEIALLGHPLSAFRSSPEFHRSGAVAPCALSGSVGQLPPMRSLPLRRFLNSGQPLTS